TLAIAAEHFLECLYEAARRIDQTFAVRIVTKPCDQSFCSGFRRFARWAFDWFEFRFDFRFSARKTLYDSVHHTLPFDRPLLRQPECHRYLLHAAKSGASRSSAFLGNQPDTIFVPNCVLQLTGRPEEKNIYARRRI